MRKSRNQASKGGKKASNNGSIRIIAGKHRGRKLPVLMSDGLRPTTDRVKETVFNWLMPYVHQSHCLDCFAGAGSLGFEAYSRGAESVSFIELDKAAANQLTQNKTLLNASSLTIHHQDALAFLANTTPKAFDIVFIDPPFRQNLVQKTISIIENQWLAKSALIYVEMESENSTLSIPSTWHLLKEKVAGQVIYRLYQRTEQ